ncbi:MAG: hypothetical protein K9I82_02505 [Chitinophagaceae bacterium]|nr:hypothetical protein [Chitinophagaceae bacterium]
MKQFFLFVFTTVIIANGTKAQPSEKFLKLNRVLVLDSVKVKTITTKAETIFSITVPTGVYWKIESINFTPSFDQIWSGGTGYMRVKINSIDLLQPSNQIYNNQVSSVYALYPFLKTTPVWVGPGTVINAYATFNNYYQNPQLSFDLLLNAMEFSVEQ